MEIPAQQNSTFQKPIFQRASYWDPVQTAPEWGALEYGNPTTAEFYIPEAYIPKGSLLGSCTNGFKMWLSGIYKFHHPRNSIFQKPIFQNYDPVQAAPG